MSCLSASLVVSGGAARQGWCTTKPLLDSQGMVLAAIEGWPSDTGFWFMMSNIASLPNPVVQAEPESDVGRVFANLLLDFLVLSVQCKKD